MIDFNKPLETKNGTAVRILATDRKGKFPVIGLVTAIDKVEESVGAWSIDGEYAYNPDFDLVNVVEKSSKFVNVYDKPFSPIGCIYDTIDRAQQYRNKARKGSGVIEIQFEDGVAVNVVLHRDD